MSNISLVAAFCRETLSKSSMGAVHFDAKTKPELVREVSGGRPASWGAVSMGLEGDVNVHNGDADRFNALKRKETQLAARLGIPVQEAAVLLEKHKFDVDDAVRAEKDARARGIYTCTKNTRAPKHAYKPREGRAREGRACAG